MHQKEASYEEENASSCTWAQMDKCHCSSWLDKAWFSGAQQETNPKHLWCGEL